MSDVIKFEFDHPVELALRFTEPRVFPPSDRYPGGDDRHMFSTTDGRVMYVTPLTSARIMALHLAQGECFYICKRKNGRLTEYCVSREPIAARPVANNGMGHKKVLPPLKTNLPSNLYYSPERKAFSSPETASEPAPTPSLEEQLRASIEMVQRRKAGEQGDGTLAIMAPPAPAARPAVAERLAPAVAEFSSRLVLETTALVDVFAQVLRHASDLHGNAVKADDVRSLLVTCYINASKARNAA
jgi:hypothetical protein